jgi:uncharacterized DUF497 family protein
MLPFEWDSESAEASYNHHGVSFPVAASGSGELMEVALQAAKNGP